MVRSFEPSSKGPRFETTFRPVTINIEERICQLSVIPGNKAKGIRRCGHIERRHKIPFLIGLLFIGYCVLCVTMCVL